MQLSNFENFEFKLNDKENYDFKKLINSFSPTGTSNVLLNAILNYNPPKGKLLDLGSGIGIIGIMLFLKEIASSPVYLSDVNPSSLRCINENAKNYNCNVIYKTGSLFEPWNNEKFDIIVNDVSGISSEIANISPWFKNVPCESGVDGTNLTLKIISKTKHHLNENGLFFLPIISLCNSKKILNELNNNFNKVVKLVKKEWPLPEEISKNSVLLDDLQKRNIIDIKNKFGIRIFDTSVYLAHN